jgi:hypothetical protein
MKSKFLGMLLVVLCMLAVLPMQAEEGEQQNQAKGWFPVRMNIWPGLAGIPWDRDIYGVSFGLLLASQNDPGTKIIGLDLGPLVTNSTNVEGVSIAVESFLRDSEGFQIGIGCDGSNFLGVQLSAIVNIARDSKKVVQISAICNDADTVENAIQISLFNKAAKGNAIQIGIMNVLENGFLPVFPLFNFSVK